jgi:hypothetical protein
MDPNKTLANIRAITHDIRTRPVEEVFDLADELAEFVNDLDTWLTQGGYPPTAWDWSQCSHPDQPH